MPSFPHLFQLSGVLGLKRNGDMRSACGMTLTICSLVEPLCVYGLFCHSCILACSFSYRAVCSRSSSNSPCSCSWSAWTSSNSWTQEQEQKRDLRKADKETNKATLWSHTKKTRKFGIENHRAGKAASFSWSGCCHLDTQQQMVLRAVRRHNGKFDMQCSLRARVPCRWKWKIFMKNSYGSRAHCAYPLQSTQSHHSGLVWSTWAYILQT